MNYDRMIKIASKKPARDIATTSLILERQKILRKMSNDGGRSRIIIVGTVLVINRHIRYQFL